MQLKCRQCETMLRAADVDVDSLVARCHHCGWVFGQSVSPFRRSAQSDASATSQDDAPTTRRPGIPRPPRVEVVDRNGNQAIMLTPIRHYLWTWAAAFIVGGMSLVMFGVLFAAKETAMAVSSGLLGAAFLAQGLSGMLRKVYIELDGANLVVRHAFLWPNTVVPVRDLQQLYVTQAQDRNALYHYGLAALVHGSERKLTSYLSSPLVPLFIEQTIEKQLAIEDREVAGEYRFPSLLARKKPPTDPSRPFGAPRGDVDERPSR